MVLPFERRKTKAMSHSQSKGVLQPTESLMLKPRVQQRPSGNDGVQPLEKAATAATPREAINVKEAFIVRTSGLPV